MQQEPNGLRISPESGQDTHTQNISGGCKGYLLLYSAEICFLLQWIFCSFSLFHVKCHHKAFTTGNWASHFGGKNEVTDIDRACAETAKLLQSTKLPSDTPILCTKCYTDPWYKHTRLMCLNHGQTFEVELMFSILHEFTWFDVVNSIPGAALFYCFRFSIFSSLTTSNPTGRDGRDFPKPFVHSVGLWIWRETLPITYPLSNDFAPTCWVKKNITNSRITCCGLQRFLTQDGSEDEPYLDILEPLLTRYPCIHKPTMDVTYNPAFFRWLHEQVKHLRVVEVDNLLGHTSGGWSPNMHKVWESGKIIAMTKVQKGTLFLSHRHQ